MKSVGEEIVEVVRRERKKQGISVKELAEKAGCSARIIDYWESGKRTADRIGTVDSVLKALGVEYRLGSSANSDFESRAVEIEEPKGETEPKEEIEEPREERVEEKTDDKKAMLKKAMGTFVNGDRHE